MHRALAALTVLAIASTAVWQVLAHHGNSIPLSEETAGAGTTVTRAVASARMLSAINAARSERGRGPLELSRKLSHAATKHAREMALLGYFAHRSANGRSFWKRILRYYALRGYRVWSVGENLAWHESPVTSSGVVRRWMNSGLHRANLLGRWREVGIGSARVADAPGFFDGRNVAIVTVDFGRRSR